MFFREQLQSEESALKNNNALTVKYAKKQIAGKQIHIHTTTQQARQAAALVKSNQKTVSYKR